MKLHAPLNTPSLPRLSHEAFVDEEAVTLRLRPLRWRDRVLPDALRWSGAAATIAAVTGGLLFFATPSEAARIETRAEPMMAPMTKAAPALVEARFDAVPEAIEGEDEEVVIIIEDDTEDDEDIVIFDDSLDAASAAEAAQLHIERNEHAVALQYALEAVAAQPRRASHHALLGEAYRLNGDRKAARRAFRRARRLRR
jgi:tetratricopeptide (TPR) repeat protein